MVAADLVSTTGQEGAIYPFLVTMEESLEMLAFLLAGHTLIAYLERECDGFNLTLRTADSSDETQRHHARSSDSLETDRESMVEQIETSVE